MSTPDSSGDILRAIAHTYREEFGPAKAEQLVSRAMARAGTPSPRSKAMRALAPTLALAVSVLAVGLIVLVNDAGAPAADPDPPAPVASSALPDEPVAEVVSSPVVSIPKQELEAALALIDQQKELEAAEVVVRALSAIFPPVEVQSREQGATSATADAEAEQAPTTSSVAGAVPPEQGTHPEGASSGAGDAESTEPSGDRAASGDSAATSTTTGTSPTIEELGQALKVEVEELLSADPQQLAEAAEEARNAATPILEYGEEPTILLPPDG